MVVWLANFTFHRRGLAPKEGMACTKQWMDASSCGGMALISPAFVCNMSWMSTPLLLHKRLLILLHPSTIYSGECCKLQMKWLLCTSVLLHKQSQGHKVQGGRSSGAEHPPSFAKMNEVRCVCFVCRGMCLQ